MLPCGAVANSLNRCMLLIIKMCMGLILKWVYDGYMINIDNCWLWAGQINYQDYGLIQVKLNGKWTTRRAHRVMYENLVGGIPDHLVCDHLCRVRRCVNPDHIEIITNKENIARGIGASAKNAQKTHCVNGHEFTPENTRVRHHLKKGRECRQCVYARQRIYYRKTHPKKD